MQRVSKGDAPDDAVWGFVRRLLALNFRQFLAGDAPRAGFAAEASDIAPFQGNAAPCRPGPS